MRRCLMVLLAGSLAGLLALPALSPAAEVRYGFKLGLNAAFLRGTETILYPPGALDMDWVMRFAYCGGGFIALDLTEKLSLQAEALITKKGSATLRPLWSEYEEYRYSFSIRYLEIPLLIKLRPGGRVFSLYAGPALGIKIGDKLLRDTPTLPAEILPVDGLKSTDQGLVFGFGFSQNPGVLAELRYTMGLTRIFGPEARIYGPEGEDLAIKNGVVALLFGWSF